MIEEEKTTLKKFIALYFSSTFIFLVIIFYLSYKVQLNMLYNLNKEQMKSFSFKIASNLILAQMEGKQPNCKAVMIGHKKYKFAFYDKNKKFISGDKIERKGLILEDKSPLGHMGVWYILVEYNGFENEKKELILKMVFIFLISYLILAIIGYYLIKLFMKPIKNSRIRLNRFIKDTIHEINTPITVIMMCANEDALKNPKNIDRLLISAKRVSELYKDLTYLFLNNKNEKKELLSLDKILNEQLKYFEVLAQSKSITIVKKISELKLNISKEDAKRVISNLLSNAIKYNKRGGIIEVFLDSNRFKVCNSGESINSKDLKNIFQRYYRASSLDGGFGIGLNIVKKIVDENNFKLNVTSNNSRSCFEIIFSHTILTLNIYPHF